MATANNRRHFMMEDHMPERIDIPFTNEHFAAWCQKMLGQPYWYGAVVYKCTKSLLTRKAKQYPSHYGSNRIARYQDDITKNKVCADCVGGCKGYAWTNGGQGVLESIGANKTFASQYGGNGCPDKSANGMFEWAKSKGMDWGVIGTLPELSGVALRFDGHVGYYIGNGYAVEWRGFNYGCVKTKVSARNWTHWYKLPFIRYAEAGQPIPEPEYTLGSRQLTKGMTGSDVKALQETLLELGYTLPKYGADADFGSETERAVVAFQKKQGLTEDGKYGEITHKALMASVADAEHPTDDPSEEAPAPKDPVPGSTVVIVPEGGKVNVRVGNGTEYARISTVASGTSFPFVATATNGWHAIIINGQVGWVSRKYSQVI
jgi:hypothetical protein